MQASYKNAPLANSLGSLLACAVYPWLHIAGIANSRHLEDDMQWRTAKAKANKLQNIRLQGDTFRPPGILTTQKGGQQRNKEHTATRRASV